MAEDEIGKAPSKWIVFFVVLLILVLVLALGYWAVQTTAVGASLKLSISTSISKGMASISERISGVKKQARGIGDWTNPTAVKTEEPKGIEITEVYYKTFFLPTEDISITGSGVVYALEDETNVDFSCNMDGRPGKIDGSKVSKVVLPNTEEPFGVLCNFEPDPNIKAADIKVSTQKQVKFSAIYIDYKTKAELRLWTLPKIEKDNLYEANINPFDRYRNIFESQRGEIRLKLDDKSRTTTSSYHDGPMKVSMKVFEPQPLSEGEPYKLFVNIQNDKVRWGGELVRRQTGDNGRVFIKFPSRVESNCGEIILEPGQEEYTFDCDFTIRALEDTLGWIPIDVEVVYDYEFSKVEIITIVPKELV